MLDLTKPMKIWINYKFLRREFTIDVIRVFPVDDESCLMAEYISPIFGIERKTTLNIDFYGNSLPIDKSYMDWKVYND